MSRWLLVLAWPSLSVWQLLLLAELEHFPACGDQRHKASWCPGVVFFSQEFAVFIFSSLSQLIFFGPSWKCGIDISKVLLFPTCTYNV